MSEDGGLEERKYEPKFQEEEKIYRGWAVKVGDDLLTGEESSWRMIVFLNPCTPSGSVPH
jgi:hypothetical protein